MGQIIFCSIHCWRMEDKKLFTEEKRERDCCSLKKNQIFSLFPSFFSPKLLAFKSNVNFSCTTQIVSTERKKILNQMRSLHFILFGEEYFLSQHLDCSGDGWEPTWPELDVINYIHVLSYKIINDIYSRKIFPYRYHH